MAHKLKIGNIVRWNDPAIMDYPVEDRESALKREFVIYDIQGEDDDSIISIKEIGGSTEAEVYASELELTNPNQNKMWVLRVDVVLEEETIRNDTYIFSYEDEENARRLFNSIVTDERAECIKNDWEITTYTDEEFESYEDGYYKTNHSVVHLALVDIE